MARDAVRFEKGYLFEQQSEAVVRNLLESPFDGKKRMSAN
jgi:hypothetical protein